MKIVFTMSSPEEKKNSTRFNFEKVDFQEGDGEMSAADFKKFKPSFYIPKPLAENAKRIRVTIEEL